MLDMTSRPDPAPTVARQIGAAVHRRRPLSAEGMMERLLSRLFHGLVYPQIWEDPVVDMRALAIAPGQRLVCIASGGCNMMSYLTAGPASLLAVDLSPAHVALGRLKLAAARHLPDHDAFFDFFGRADRAANVRAYDRHLAPHLDPATRAWWEARTPFGRRIGLFARGFYRHGALGRFIGAAHLVARLGGTDLRGLVACRTIDEQRAWFNGHVDPLFASPLVQALARHPAALFGLGIPPAQYELLADDGDGDVLPVLRERLRRLFCDFPLRENYFAWQALTRRYPEPGQGALPPYLEPAAFDALRVHAAGAEVVNRSLTTALAGEAAETIYGFSLLDAQDWMTRTQLADLWREITRTAAPGATVIFRTGGAPDILPRQLPSDLLSAWQSDRVTARACHEADRSAIYGGFHIYRRRAG
ncbi:DUF3419 family protein [Cereibacter sphaeroides]|uniref:DUF3419 family protein n=1 Tax=Cereibacter sphaeroides TaxID=1063 RepID=UPI001F2EC6FF|nr:DUF3419 family protein [Cereibacter sphaeroides]MCE6957692.1 DUF3419 family protein [Cereibacter sphaeroides]MCE6971457.1 DUF3419 family protein [Cereibacter sphaeroides]